MRYLSDFVRPISTGPGKELYCRVGTVQGGQGGTWAGLGHVPRGSSGQVSDIQYRSILFHIIPPSRINFGGKFWTSKRSPRHWANYGRCYSCHWWNFWYNEFYDVLWFYASSAGVRIAQVGTRSNWIRSPWEQGHWAAGSFQDVQNDLKWLHASSCASFLRLGARFHTVPSHCMWTWLP